MLQTSAVDELPKTSKSRDASPQRTSKDPKITEDEDSNLEMNPEAEQPEEEEAKKHGGDAPPTDPVQPPPNPNPYSSPKTFKDLLDSLDAVSEGTRQLYEMRTEEKHLKEELCTVVVDIINFADVLVPISPETLRSAEFPVKDAQIGCDGVIHLSFLDGERRFKRLSEIGSSKAVALIYDIAPKLRTAIDSELKRLGDNIDLLDKTLANLKRIRPALKTDQNEEGMVEIVKDTENSYSAPKLKNEIESKLKRLGDNIDLLDKTLAKFKNPQPEDGDSEEDPAEMVKEAANDKHATSS